MNKRKPYDRIRAATVKATADKFNVTESYVRSCVKGDINYGRSDEIKKYYHEIYQKLREIIS